MEPRAFHGHVRAGGRLARGEEAETSIVAGLARPAAVIGKQAGVPLGVRNLGEVAGRRFAVVLAVCLVLGAVGRPWKEALLLAM
eukprot:8592443-Alexandrium_andersonii.AAC.1